MPSFKTVSDLAATIEGFFFTKFYLISIFILSTTNALLLVLRGSGGRLHFGSRSVSIVVNVNSSPASPPPITIWDFGKTPTGQLRQSDNVCNMAFLPKGINNRDNFGSVLA